MARLPRLEITHQPHLVVQRVLAGNQLVRDAEDERALRAALLESARTQGMSVHAYAALPDRLWVLATPTSAGALSAFMQGVGRRYVAAYNRRHQRSGGLWAGRYRAAVIEAARYLLDAMAFVELAPWREGMVPAPDHVQGVCSSLPHHLGQASDPLVQDHRLFWTLGNTPFDREAAWRRRLLEGQTGTMADQLARTAEQGWVLGSPTFLQEMALATSRPLSPRPRGRPAAAAG